MIDPMDQPNTNGEPRGRITHLIQILVTFIQFNQVLHYAPPKQSRTFIVGKKCISITSVPAFELNNIQIRNAAFIIKYCSKLVLDRYSYIQSTRSTAEADVMQHFIISNHKTPTHSHHSPWEIISLPKLIPNCVKFLLPLRNKFIWSVISLPFQF